MKTKKSSKRMYITCVRVIDKESMEALREYARDMRLMYSDSAVCQIMNERTRSKDFYLSDTRCERTIW